MDIRLLNEADAGQYRALRLRALREHPEAFAASYEEESALPVAQTVELLRSMDDEHYILAAYSEEQLTGIVSFFRNRRRKIGHRAHIGEMYVVPEARGSGIGRALLREVVMRAGNIDGLEELVLAVTAGNAAAYGLYTSAGFWPYAVEPGYLKIDGRYYDIQWLRLRLAEQVAQ